jgi:exosortase C (VPDSG-CTERM-specific)
MRIARACSGASGLFCCTAYEIHESPMMEPEAQSRRQLSELATASAVLILCFSRPLYQLVRYAVSSEFYSYVTLIPFISIYLVWIKRGMLHPLSQTDKRCSFLPTIVGLIALAGFWTTVLLGIELEREDSLALTIFSFVMLSWGICGWFLDRKTLRSVAFPLGLLILMVPFPVFLRTMVETSLQHCSAIAALGMFELTGTPVFYQDLSFQLSDITLRVAPECSGIQSTLALFITSLLAGYFFLRSNWRRWALTFAVLPLAILRNGFRVFTIGELCVHIGPEMIDSKIHHKGGPVFFILSLVPFLIFLFYLIRSDRLASMSEIHPS